MGGMRCALGQRKEMRKVIRISVSDTVVLVVIFADVVEAASATTTGSAVVTTNATMTVSESASQSINK